MSLRLVSTRSGERPGFDLDGIVREDLGGSLRFRRSGLRGGDRFIHQEASGVERSVCLLEGKLVEVDGPSGWQGLGDALKFMRANERVDPWRIALFEQCGELALERPTSRDHPDQVVCECTGITRSEVEKLVPSCIDRLGIGRECGAGAVCGGCAPLIDEIAGQSSMTTAELVGIDPLHDGIARFRYRYLSGGAATVDPGAYVLVQALVDGRSITRSYTVVMTGQDGRIDVIVKREAGGVFSRWLHDHASPGAIFRLSRPQSTRRVPIGGRIVLIAAGIGITPALVEMSRAVPESLRIHWSVRGSRHSFFADLIRSAASFVSCSITIRDTTVEGRQREWSSLFPPAGADAVVVCGPPSFRQAVLDDLLGAGWDRTKIHIESFDAHRSKPAVLQHIDSFDYLQEPVVARSFHLTPTEGVNEEACAFLRQFYFEHGATAAFEHRWAEVCASIAKRGTYVQTYEELAFGARLAWRNSARCIGRFFWKSLEVRDLRHLETEEAIFAALVSHLEDATGDGDIRPIISVFRPGEPNIRILNPQLILYAGYRGADGSVHGDPKNIELTDLAMRLGWRGKGTRFDVLPVMIRIGESTPKVFVLPQRAVLEVELTHPRRPSFSELGLRWFAVPAISGMALDIGGIQYSAAPSNGFYMGTEIGSLNLADASRYDEAARVAEVMGLDLGSDPLWRDQAVLDLNASVLHSFSKAGVRILDHHSLSAYFVKFREAEALAQRPSYGHWAWVMPPLGGNLSPIWRDHTLQKKILKPNYFYQSMPAE